jgi:hypothetical protein
LLSPFSFAAARYVKTLRHEAQALQRAALEKEREETAEAEDDDDDDE